MDKIPAMEIAELIISMPNPTSQTIAEKYPLFTVMYLSESTSAVAPMLKVEEKDGKNRQKFPGTAVFKADKMIGKLDETEGRGLMWVHWRGARRRYPCGERHGYASG